MIPKRISEKAILAFLFPFLSTCAAVLSDFVVSGTIDTNALRVGVAGLIASGMALLGAYVGRREVVYGAPREVAAEEPLESAITPDSPDEIEE